LPQGLRAIGFPVYYRARKLEVHITSARVRIRLGPGAQDPIRLRVWDERIDLPPGTEIIRESAPDGPAVPRP
jgi:trehalose/maltose hydrolase-like predicted phosphorylase